MAAAYQWGYRVAMIVAGAAPLLLAESYGWNFSYAVMAGADGGRHAGGAGGAARGAAMSLRPIHAEGIRPAPAARDRCEWLVRLAILAAGALFLGSGLAANARRVRERADGGWARPALATRWSAGVGVGGARLGPASVAVLVGFGVIVLATLPLPGCARGRALYLSSALGDPLRDFFTRYRRQRGADPRADLPLPPLRTSC